MKYQRILRLLVLLVAALAAQGAAAAPESVLITTQIFRIRGNVSGDMSLTDNIWSGDPRKPDADKAFSFFTTAKLSVASHHLTIDDKGWRWDVKPLPTGEDVTLIGAPRIQVPIGQGAAISFSADQALEYFVARGGGLYELKKIQQPMGLELKVTVLKDADGRIRLENMTLTSRLVESRKPLEGTTLNVGEPVVSSHEHKADPHLKLSRDYGFLLSINDGQGLLLARLRIDPAPPPPFPAKNNR